MMPKSTIFIATKSFNSSNVQLMFTCSLEKGIIDENVCPVLKAQEEEQFSLNALLNESISA